MDSRRNPAASVFIVLGAALALLAAPDAFAAKFVTFDPPNSRDTYAVGINADGVIVGDFLVPNGGNAGFLRKTDGSFATFAIGRIETGASGVNLSRTAVGSYAYYNFMGDLRFNGYTRMPDDKITEIAFPGAVSTGALAINDSGTIAGWYEQPSGDVHGFVLSTAGTFRRFDPLNSVSTYVEGIDRKGTVAGWYEVGHNIKGFIRNPDGALKPFHVPNASQGTYAYAINNKGAVAGFWLDANRFPRGFVREASGTITVFDVPGDVDGTYVNCINDAGMVAGYYQDAGYVAHGYVRSADGTITTFDAPGDYTYPYAIDDKGEVTGNYGSGTPHHGFLWVP